MPRSIPEALWKQEGASQRVRGRKRPWSQRAGKSTKSLKMRKKRKFGAILRSLPPSTHNLKVAGSNPAPATNFTEWAVLLLRAALFSVLQPKIYCPRKLNSPVRSIAKSPLAGLITICSFCRARIEGYFIHGSCSGPDAHRIGGSGITGVESRRHFSSAIFDRKAIDSPGQA
jgi:hypothetical protein